MMAETKDRFAYQGEKLSQARSSLMAPHPMGEDRSFASAFEFCSRAFYDFDVERIKDENAHGWIDTIKRLMSTDGVSDPTDEGTFIHRARALTDEEKREFSNAVDELASWFNMEFWSDD
jgi:hypothetical protein